MVQKVSLLKMFIETEINFDIKNGIPYLNATKTAKAFKKDLSNWRRSSETIAYIEYVSSLTELTMSDLIIIKSGGNDKTVQGTWIHHSLADEFMRWCQKDSKRTAGEYLYLVTDGNAVKIGFTTKIKERIDQLQTGNPNLLTLIQKFKIKEPRKLEAFLHSQYAHKRLIGEWFKLSQDEICKIYEIAKQFVIE